MKKFILSFCLYLLIANSVKANTGVVVDGDYRRMYLDAEQYLTDENYSSALPLYLKLDSIKTNANLKFKIGICYLNASTYKAKAIPYLEDATKDIAKKYVEGVVNEKQAPLSTIYYLARAYHLNYQFDKAIETYEKYKTELGTDEKYAKDVADLDHDIETCNNGKELIKDPKQVIVQNLGPAINSAYPDYSPVVALDEQTLIFTSRRAGGTSDAKEPNGQFFEDIYVSEFKNEEWQAAKSIGTNINSVGHEATVNLTTDGQQLLIYKDDGGNGNLYLSKLKGAEWGVPEYLGAPINTFSWETHACFSFDNKILYFISDRPGGIGGRDIYKCLKLPNGQWGPAENLGPTINTPYDEDGIFIHPDGKRIYFSSKGHKSMGGFDIFTSVINDENGFWSEPTNIGYPVNTPDDDIFYVTTADGKRAFFCSDKEGGYGEKDIYMLKFPENEPRDITILVGRIINYTTEDISNNQIAITDIISGDTLQVLNANSHSGKYGANLPLGHSYKTVYTVNGKVIFSEVLASPKDKGYQVIKREIPYGNQGVVKDSTHIKDSVATIATTQSCDPHTTTYQLYFRYNQKIIDSKSKEFVAFTNSIKTCLTQNPTYEIQIEASASKVPTRTFGSNEKLTKLRAKEAKVKIFIALTEVGMEKSAVHFADAKELVQGPEYKKDFLQNRTTYEQYQYIKVTVQPKK